MITLITQISHCMLLLDILKLHYNICHLYLKEATDNNICDYVINLHMDKVKILLINTNKPVRDVAELVGYAKVSSFIKAFKKFVGISPNKFRVVKHEKN